LDTKGNIFGGFTPVEWESPLYAKHSECKADDSLTNFLFTLKNPHNIPARRFALRAEWKHLAICCDFEEGPWFRGGIRVTDDCNTKPSYAALGSAYTNDTGLDKDIVFTGSGPWFKLREIEVFEITN
jgi:hypothetical protein